MGLKTLSDHFQKLGAENCYDFNGEHRMIWNKGDLPTSVWVV